MKCIKEKCKFYFKVDNDADDCSIFNELYAIEQDGECHLSDRINIMTKQLRIADEQFKNILSENGFI